MEQRTQKDKALRALQLTQLEILQEVDRICRKHKINYSLGGGTCLGQYRHGGFIPWDDDIDLDMTRENYMKFVEIAPNEINRDKFNIRYRSATPPAYLSVMRIEALGTKISKGVWTNNNMNIGVFIEIFVSDYLPNEENERRALGTKIYTTRCAMYYKMYKIYPRKIKSKSQIRRIAKYSSPKALLRREARLIESVKNRPTNWMLDDGIINGDHGGYPAYGIDDYRDVTFEDITVMNKSYPDNFLTTLYGSHFGEWLPPIKRITHHMWDTIDLGEYAQKFGAPDNYQDYLTVGFSPAKLKHMKKVSLEMVSEIKKICEAEKLRHFQMGYDADLIADEVTGLEEYWLSPAVVGMPREDYEIFTEVCSKYFGKKYQLQNSKTDKLYKFTHSRMRLNYTSIRDTSVPVLTEEAFHSGFYVRIIPLDRTASTPKGRKKHLKNLRRLNDRLNLKWTRSEYSYFRNLSFKKKIKVIMMVPYSVDSLLAKVDKEARRYEGQNTGWYIDSTAYEVNGIILSDETLGNGSLAHCGEQDVILAEDREAFTKALNHTRKIGIYKDFDGFKASYKAAKCDEEKETALEKYIRRLEKRYPRCYLNFYDDPEYQLSVLRYDEKNDRYLTNEEVMGL